MIRLTASIFILLAVFSTTLLGKPVPVDKKAENVKQPDYFPLGVGNKWHQQLEVNGQVHNMVCEITKIENINKKPLARLDVTLNGKPAAISEHLASSEKGVFRHRMNGLALDPPLCLVKYPIKEGEVWESKLKIGPQEALVSCTVGKWEQVEVPAGKFKAIRVTISTTENGKPVVSEYWFAAGVGIVMQEVDTGGVKVTMKLEKFVEGKSDPKNPK